jgi:hypothetical protein
MHGEHVHTKRRCADFRHASADVTEPDDAKGLPENVAAAKGKAIKCGIAAQGHVHLSDLLGEAQHHSECVLGDRLSVQSRLIGHQNAGFGAVFDVGRIVTGTAGAHRNEVRAISEESPVDACQGNFATFD